MPSPAWTDGSSIKYSYHRGTGHQLLTSIDTDQVSGIMQRSQVGTLFHSLNNFVSNYNRASKLLATVYYTMTNSADLGHISDYAMFLISQSSQNHLNCLVVIRHSLFLNNSILTGRLML
jgi:hypothetical protein